MDEADLLFQLDGDADVMKYITLGIPRTMDEVIERSMPRVLQSIKTNRFWNFCSILINQMNILDGSNLRIRNLRFY